MNISTNKVRTPLGRVLFFDIEPWQKTKIKKRLEGLGLTEGGWRSIHERTAAYRLPTYVRDVIIEELPDYAYLFEHPSLKKKPSKTPLGFD